MKIEIKSRWDSTVLFTCEAASLLLALEAARKAGANLYGADLRGADLRGADLRDANLTGLESTPDLKWSESTIWDRDPAEIRARSVTQGQGMWVLNPEGVR